MKHRKAAAVSYTRGDYAPRVLARGQGEAAEKLCSIAVKSGVPIVEFEGLADSLSQLNVFEEIPEVYWISIVEILKFVYELRGDNELPERE